MTVGVIDGEDAVGGAVEAGGDIGDALTAGPRWC